MRAPRKYVQGENALDEFYDIADVTPRQLWNAMMAVDALGKAYVG